MSPLVALLAIFVGFGVYGALTEPGEGGGPRHRATRRARLRRLLARLPGRRRPDDAS